MDNRVVTIKVVSNFGDAYKVSLVINTKFDAEEQVDTWIDKNLVNVQNWAWD